MSRRLLHMTSNRVCSLCRTHASQIELDVLIIDSDGNKIMIQDWALVLETKATRTA